MKDLKQKIVLGGIAKICAQATNFTLRVGSLMILARLLDPRDFGLVAMVTTVTGVVNLFRDFGLSTASVQRTTITDDEISTLFWINLLCGGVLTSLVLVAAPIIARFYHEPRLVLVTVTLSASFLINAAGVQHSALLERQMRFTALAAIETFSLVFSIAVGIGMAAHGFGPWALVGMTLAASLCSSASVWVAAPWIPGRPRPHSGIRSMLRFGGTVTLNNLVAYVAYNLDKVLLGRFWGADALGIYGRAYQLINLPTENLNSAVGGVTFSALSRVKEDTRRLKSYFLKGYSLVVALTLPVTLVCALFADDLIVLILGQKWSEVTPIFRLLAPTILVFGMINPMWWLLLSLGLVGRSLRIAVALTPIVIAGYLVGLPHGPKGVALGYSLAMTLWVVPHLAWCVHGTVISFRDILGAVGRPLLSALVAAAVGWVAISLSPEYPSPLGRLCVGVPVILIGYLGMLLYGMGQKSFYLNLVSSLIQRSPATEKTVPSM